MWKDGSFGCKKYTKEANWADSVLLCLFKRSLILATQFELFFNLTPVISLKCVQWFHKQSPLHNNHFLISAILWFPKMQFCYTFVYLLSPQQSPLYINYPAGTQRWNNADSTLCACWVVSCPPKDGCCRKVAQYLHTYTFPLLHYT